MDPETREAIGQLGAGLDRLGERFDRMGERFDRMDERFDRVDERFDQVATDLRGEIRTSATETRAYVDERIQVSTVSILHDMGESETRTRRHFDVVTESLRSDIRAIVEGMAASREQTERRVDDEAGRTDGLEGRVLRLEVRVLNIEADRKPRRPRRR